MFCEPDTSGLDSGPVTWVYVLLYNFLKCFFEPQLFIYAMWQLMLVSLEMTDIYLVTATYDVVFTSFSKLLTFRLFL